MTRAEDKARIVVCDHGPGIAAAERERVFEPFYRPAGRAESAGGWGLGLSLVRQIAKRHGGGVFCEAEPGGRQPVRGGAGDGGEGAGRSEGPRLALYGFVRWSVVTTCMIAFSA